eukprot:gene4425-biopygen21966
MVNRRGAAGAARRKAAEKKQCGAAGAALRKLHAMQCSRVCRTRSTAASACRTVFPRILGTLGGPAAPPRLHGSWHRRLRRPAAARGAHRHWPGAAGL